MTDSDTDTPSYEDPLAKHLAEWQKELADGFPAGDGGPYPVWTSEDFQVIKELKQALQEWQSLDAAMPLDNFPEFVARLQDAEARPTPQLMLHYMDVTLQSTVLSEESMALMGSGEAREEVKALHHKLLASVHAVAPSHLERLMEDRVQAHGDVNPAFGSYTASITFKAQEIMSEEYEQEAKELPLPEFEALAKSLLVRARTELVDVLEDEASGISVNGVELSCSELMAREETKRTLLSVYHEPCLNLLTIWKAEQAFVRGASRLQEAIAQDEPESEPAGATATAPRSRRI